MKRGGPRRDWSDARAKVDAEGACRVCGTSVNLEAAHILSRKHDRFDLARIPWAGKTWRVEPVRIIPLCGGPFAGNASCHAQYDAHSLDLLSYLFPREQAQAVLDAGSIESARRRLAPSEYRPTREEAA